jgi:DNA helicase TIP49 (TBP-interacting protein)
MTKRKRKISTKPPEMVEAQTTENTPSVALVKEEIPTATPSLDTSDEVKTTVEEVVADIADGMVTAKVVNGDIRFIDFIDGTIKHYNEGDIFTSTKKRVDSLDQRFIKRV